MKETFFLEKIQNCLKEHNISPSVIDYVFESFAGPSGETGESFLVFTKLRLYIFSRPLLGEFELTKAVLKEAVKSVVAKENYLGNLEFSINGTPPVAHKLEILSLQQNRWDELCEYLQKCFPKKFEREITKNLEVDNSSLDFLREKSRDIDFEGELFLEPISIAEDLEETTQLLRSMVDANDFSEAEIVENSLLPLVEISPIVVDESQPEYVPSTTSQPKPKPKLPPPQKTPKGPKNLVKQPIKPKHHLMSGGSFYSSAEPKEKVSSCVDEIIGCASLIFIAVAIIYALIALFR